MAEDISTTTNIKFSANKQGGSKYFELETPATADHADTILVDIRALCGAEMLKAIRAYRHTTTDSVVVDDDAPTTAVSAGVLTITIGGTTDNKKRVFHVWVE
jgi:phage terminase large subunit-like protein